MHKGQEIPLYLSRSVCVLASTFTTSFLLPISISWRRRIALRAESGPANSQKPNAERRQVYKWINAQVKIYKIIIESLLKFAQNIPWTLFHDWTAPQDAKMCRIMASGAFSVIFPTNTVTGGPSVGSALRLLGYELRSGRGPLLPPCAEPDVEFWWCTCDCRGWWNDLIGGPPMEPMGAPANICLEI